MGLTGDGVEEFIGIATAEEIASIDTTNGVEDLIAVFVKTVADHRGTVTLLRVPKLDVWRGVAVGLTVEEHKVSVGKELLVTGLGQVLGLSMDVETGVLIDPKGDRIADDLIRFDDNHLADGV